MATAQAFDEFEYVLKSDRDKPLEEQTVFRLKPLSFREKSECERVEITVDRDGHSHHAIDRMGLARKVLTYGLCGWRNLLDAQGKPVEFRRVSEGGRFALPEDMLNLILPWAVELANAITDRSEVTEEAAKNS